MSGITVQKKPDRRRRARLRTMAKRRDCAARAITAGSPGGETIMKRTNKYFMAKVTTSFAILFIFATSVMGQTSDRKDGMRFVPDPINQVFYLSETAAAMGLNITTTPNPSACRHYQGIVRTEDAQKTPFFLVTRSGNTPDIGETLCDDSPGETRNGHLVVFKLDSREKHGERLRSNRLNQSNHVDFTQPPMSLDRATIYFTFTGGNPKDPDPAKRPGLVLGDGPNNLPPRAYQHPGGMQLVGNILAVALETPRPGGYWSDYLSCTLDANAEACLRYYSYEKSTNGNIIQFYDVSIPEEPKFLSQFTPRNSSDQNLSKLGVVGITPLKNGKYLMVVTGGGGNSWQFYRSKGTDLASEDLEWEQVRSMLAPVVTDPHQTLNFIREDDINGRLFIAGARGHVEFGPAWEDRERIDLYEIVNASMDFNVGEDISFITHVNSKRIRPHPSMGGTSLASLAAASTFYVSPSGEVILYNGEHDNDGPSETMKVAEFHHVDMARPGSPTFFPNADLNGPFEVNEGSSITLSGTGQQPANKAFVQLYHNRNFGPAYVTVDYSDRQLENFDNLFDYERFLFSGNLHADTARSWNWFAPQGCTIQAIDRVDEDSDIDEMKTLTGATSVQADADLSLVMHDGGTDDMDQEIDRVVFGSDCDNYYSQQIGLFWDVDGDGSFETQGNTASFSAAAVDGPGNVQVEVEARNPLGGVGSKYASVTVKNVAPQLSNFMVKDSGGNQVNGTVPFVLTGLPITVSSDFADPGTLDRQNARIAWGDNSMDQDLTFDSFDEAFGDGTGSLSDTHVFTQPGTYTIELSVADDDLDSNVTTANVEVLTPAQAIGRIVAMIDIAIAATTDPQVIDDLQHARLALVGNRPTSQNGALQMIQSGNYLSAVAFLQTSSMWLQRAALGGSDVATPILLVDQIAAALGG